MTDTTYKASDVYNNLVIGKRAKTNNTYYYFGDNTPKDIQKRWQELTGNYNDYSFADLDEYYSVLYRLSQMMSENNNFTVDDLYTIDWADDYHADRLMWLHENLSRASFYHDIKENGADGIFELIGDMQDVSRHDFASYVYYNFLGGTK